MAMAMAMALALFVSALVAAGASSIIPSAEVSQFLEDHGLPGGLLPDLVSSYTLSDEGDFEVNLDKECYHRFENLVWYGKKISGKLSYGKIEGLAGIQAKELFVWLPVTGIRVDKSSIVFEVGFVSKALSKSLFAKPPVCSKHAAADLISSE